MRSSEQGSRLLGSSNPHSKKLSVLLWPFTQKLGLRSTSLEWCFIHRHQQYPEQMQSVSA